MFVLLVLAKRQEKVSIKHNHGMRRISIGMHHADSKSIVQKVKDRFRRSDNESLDGNKETEMDPIESEEKNDTISNELSILKRPTSSVVRYNMRANNRTEPDISKFQFAYDYENGTGELYMRCGAAIFSICTMIDRCLSLIQMVEVYANNHQTIIECRITFICSMVSKVLSLLFIFLQSFFIFKYANIIINYGKNAASIGLMHLAVTNFCVSFRTIVHETIAEIRHHKEHKNSRWLLKLDFVEKCRPKIKFKIDSLIFQIGEGIFFRLLTKLGSLKTQSLLNNLLISSIKSKTYSSNWYVF